MAFWGYVLEELDCVALNHVIQRFFGGGTLWSGIGFVGYFKLKYITKKLNSTPRKNNPIGFKGGNVETNIVSSWHGLPNFIFDAPFQTSCWIFYPFIFAWPSKQGELQEHVVT